MYNEFKTVYKQEFGIDLLDEEAKEIGGRLLKLARSIVIHKQNKRFLLFKNLPQALFDDQNLV